MRLELLLSLCCLVVSVLSLVPRTQERPRGHRLRQRHRLRHGPFGGPDSHEETEQEIRRKDKSQRRYVLKKLRSHTRPRAERPVSDENIKSDETKDQKDTAQRRHMLARLARSRNPAVAGHVFGFGGDGWNINIRNLFGDGEDEWWEGPNVCVNRDEREEELTSTDEKPINPHSVFTRAKCTSLQSSYKCETIIVYGGKKKVMTTSYECCHGFTRKSSDNGCPTEVEMNDLLETAQELGLSEFIQTVESVGLDDLLLEGNYTVFAPTNLAFDDYIPMDEPFESNIVLVSPETLGMVDALSDTLSNHVVKGFVKTTDFSDEMLLKTAHPYGEIRINIYDVPEKLVTANCIPLVSTDHLATNGVIHQTKGVLTPITDTITGIISKNRELEVLKSMLGRTGLAAVLRKDGQFTLLAPTDNAFKKMPKSLRDRLTVNTGCLENVLKSHLLPHVICSGVLQGEVRTLNMLGSYLHINRTEDDKLFVDEIQVTATDIMASNGVIHLIEDVIIPEESRDIFDIARDEGTDKALSLIEEARLTKTIQTMENFTIFIPTDQAFEKLPADTKSDLKKDRRALSALLKYHIVPKDLQQRDIYHMRKLPTLNNDKAINVRQYSTFPFGWETEMTIGCAPIVKASLESCSGTAYIIDQVMLPPEESVLDVLYKDSKFSTFVSLLKKADLAESLQRGGDYTIFAPNDEAFDMLQGEELSKLKENKDKLKKFLRHHIITGSLCCSGIFEKTTIPWLKLRERTLDGSTVMLDKTNDIVSVDNAQIIRCDHQANNGIVHQVNRVFGSALKRYGQKEEPKEPTRRSNFWTITDNIGDALDEIDLNFNWDLGWDKKK